jgi:hypothetical protein
LLAHKAHGHARGAALAATQTLAAGCRVRPTAPPHWPALRSRDYNEVKELGAKSSTKRSAEQTEIARFWEYSLPPIYYGVVRSVATQPDRDLARNARMYAAIAQAMDDAMIAVFDSKYHHNFWRRAPRPQQRRRDDTRWRMDLADDAPMRRYPSGHGIWPARGRSAEGRRRRGRDAGARPPALRPRARRGWNSVDDFVREVGTPHIYAGIHYRSAIETSAAMGQRIGGGGKKLLGPERRRPVAASLLARRTPALN